MHKNQYIDGDYETTGIYGGDKRIGVKVTLHSDTIASVEVTPMATNKTSLGLQKRFAEAISDAVAGKAIAEVELDKLAGSSRTTKGFNDAIEKIKTQAAQ